MKGIITDNHRKHLINYFTNIFPVLPSTCNKKLLSTKIKKFDLFGRKGKKVAHKNQWPVAL